MSNLYQMFDTKGNAEAGSTLHICIPDTNTPAYADADKEKPVKAITLTMLGANSVAHEAFAVTQIREMRKSSLEKSEGKSDDVISDSFFSDTAAQQVDRLLAVCTAWENVDGFFSVEGVEGTGEFNKENVRTLLTRFDDVRVQAINFLDKRANFIKS